MGKPKWVIVAISLLLVILALVVTPWSKLPVLVSRHDPPQIFLEETRHELGSVQEGVEVPYVFKIRNVGGEPLIIKDVSTTCGCTLLNIDNKTIAPGKTADLQVKMDTTMKQGHVSKTIKITTNDPKHPVSQVILGALVLPPEKNPANLGLSRLSQGQGLITTALPEVVSIPDESMGGLEAQGDPHSGLTAMTSAKIFTGRCAACHVQPGKGKVGAELFEADCAMCHGSGGKGGPSGPALIFGKDQSAARWAKVRQIIAKGSPRSVTMPGFHKTNGGPLNDSEIDSLVTYLKQASAVVKP